MHFSFTEDQLALREAMHQFFQGEVTPEVLREMGKNNGDRPEGLHEKIAEQGLLGLSVPEEDGGMGMNDLDWALMTMEMGYFGLPVSVVENAYVSANLLAALPADNAVRQAYLGGIADGSKTVAIAHCLNPLINDGAEADMTIMPYMKGDGGHGSGSGQLYAVTKEQNIFGDKHESIDGSRRLVKSNWTPADGGELIAEGDAARALWSAASNRGALACAGMLLGLTQRMLEISVDYVNERKQFGKVIGTFQAVKHHLSNIVVKQEFAKPVLYRAAYALAHNEPQAALNVSHAKLAAGEAAWLATRNGIQVHGAMGYTWEVDLQLFAKAAWVLDAAWGDRGFHKQRVQNALMADGKLLGAGSSFNHDMMG